MINVTVRSAGAATSAQPRARAAADAPPSQRSIAFDTQRIVIGRGEGCDVRLPDPTVSVRHLSIRQRGSDYVVVDEGSTNGTRIGRTKLSPHAPHPIGPGCTVRAGRVVLELSVGHEAPTSQPTSVAKQIAVDLVIEDLAREGEDARPRVSIASGPDAGAEITLTHGEPAVIGRSKEAALSIGDGAASRRHASVTWRGDALFVRDLGSKSGTELGGRMVGEAATLWRPGDRLRIGETEIGFTFDAPAALAEIERAADEKVAASELELDALDPPSEPDDEAEADPGADLEPEAEAGAAPLPQVRRPAAAGWNLTDVAVIMLALGVFSLSAVGYLVLLR
jgi:pSer/pThr/pTyr-binding forkhead associated (FHA) protein